MVAPSKVFLALAIVPKEVESKEDHQEPLGAHVPALGQLFHPDVNARDFQERAEIKTQSLFRRLVQAQVRNNLCYRDS